MRTALDQRGLRRYLVSYLSYTGVIVAGFAVVLIVCARLLLGAGLAVPDAIALLVLAVRFLEPLGALGEHTGGLPAIEHAVARVQAVLRTPALAESPNPVRRLVDTGIQFDRVSYSYGDKPALRAVSFRGAPGTTTALVGPSGAGKTTVTRLIARFFDVDAGSVRVGGVDVRDYHHAMLAEQIAVMFQEVYLFDTIAENLRLARPGRDLVRAGGGSRGPARGGHRAAARRVGDASR
jgi:ATP-binding cassette subfamily B protein